MGIRGGRLGALAAVSIGTVAIGLAISVAAASTFSPRTTVQVEVAGPHVSVTAPPSR
jgi:RNase H-fold protein (predicted Holliday junction resolvase)